jgi:hypothetical protein
MSGGWLNTNNLKKASGKYIITNDDGTPSWEFPNVSGLVMIDPTPSPLITSGQIRVAAGALNWGIANTFSFAWQNPEAAEIIILELMVDITIAGGVAGGVLNAGSGANVVAPSSDLILGGDLNAVGVLVSTARVKLAANGGAIDWVTGQILVANENALRGKYYIKYCGV